MDSLFEILRNRGARRYGQEAVNQIQHALQCAALAEAARGGPTIVTAALFHDIGHLLRNRDDAEAPTMDFRHELSGRKYLSRWFGGNVCQPVALHVKAKRYLCAVDPSYGAMLSPASIHSLKLQGGALSRVEVKAFESDPHFQDAVALRRWDEEAKVPDLATPDLDHFKPIAEAAIRASAA